MPLKKISIVAKYIDVLKLRKPFRVGRVLVAEAKVLGRMEGDFSLALLGTHKDSSPPQRRGDGWVNGSLLRSWILIQLCLGLGVVLSLLPSEGYFKAAGRTWGEEAQFDTFEPRQGHFIN